MITLVERTHRFVLLAPLPKRHDAVTVRDELTKLIGRLAVELQKSLAWDQGKEMAEHANFTSRPGSPSTSATRTRPGSEARTRTRTDSYASTGPRALT